MKLSNIRKTIYAVLFGMILVFIVFLLIITSSLKNENQELRQKIESQEESIFNVVSDKLNKIQAGISQDNFRRYKIIGAEKYIHKANPNLNKGKRYNYATYIVNEVELHDNLSVELLLSVITQESNFNEKSVSTANAQGLMQVMDETAAMVCLKSGIQYYDGILNNPELNIKIGTWFLSDLMRMYNNQIELVLAHYNGGYLQKNRYINYMNLKNSTDFKKTTVEEIEEKIEKMKKSFFEGPNLSNNIEDLEKDKNYIRLMKLLSAKRFSEETKKYIPEVIARKKVIKGFLDDIVISSELKFEKVK